jgi:hypothetical protein
MAGQLDRMPISSENVRKRKARRLKNDRLAAAKTAPKVKAKAKAKA